MGNGPNEIPLSEAMKIMTDTSPLKKNKSVNVVTQDNTGDITKQEDIVRFNKKNDLHMKWDFFLNGFKAIGEIHNFGNEKYAMYSWQNDPENSFSTVESSSGSLLNHFNLYKTGQFYDHESGYSHLGHLVTRVHMTMIPFYRNIHPDYFKRLTPSRDRLNIYLNTVGCRAITDELYTDQLTPEVLISAMKFDSSKFPETLNEVELLFQHLVIMMNKHGNNITDKKDIWNDVFEVDVLMWGACFMYNEFLKNHKARLFIPEKIESGWKK